ncbi:unnamed protein product [Urochloa humidicola]
MPQVLWLILILVPLMMMTMAATATATDGRGCPEASMCGDVSIPYPFGLSDNCSWHSQFTIVCNNSFSPPRPYRGNIEVINISVETGELRVFSPVSYTCQDPKRIGDLVIQYPPAVPHLDDAQRLHGDWVQHPGIAARWGPTGATSPAAQLPAPAWIWRLKTATSAGGSAAARLTSRASLLTMKVGWNRCASNLPDNRASRFNPCSYAFVAEKGWYKFRRQDLVGGIAKQSFSSRAGDRTIPLVLNWAINGSCTESNSACISAHSKCVNSTQQDSGYLCSCLEGYEGNPYITGGCQNINECKLEQSSPCGSVTAGSICHDTDGSFVCRCKSWYRFDGSNMRCQPIFSTSTICTIIVSFAVALLMYCGIMELKKQKQRKIFNKNGGKILKDMGINIFTECELKKVTDGYKKVIGEGAFGKVYKGTINGVIQVAVKCSFTRSKAPCHDEFRNEIIFQFRINHANVVRLIGCCLEADVPKLVFEFVPNGSLYDLLHVRRDQGLSLRMRLHIAIGSAEALSYMHSQSGHNNHVHGDVKSGNILLDNDLTPKVSDFGSSKLVSIVSGYAKWCVSGDMSYIDPTYIKTGCFTEKSDVYSFRVVLLELITGKTAKYDGNNSLPINFIKSCKEEGNGRRMYDPEILMSDDSHALRYMECLHRIGMLALQCLKEDVDGRPAMAEVLMQLKQVQAIAYAPEQVNKGMHMQQAIC